MTREEWAKLSPEEQRIRVAELCGWVRSGVMRLWIRPSDKRVLPSDEIPDYLNDLNAMHEAEKIIPEHKNAQWFAALELAIYDGDEYRPIISATAAQRAEAFVLTMEGE